MTTNNNELALIAQENGLEKPKIDALLSRFSDSFNKAREVITANGKITVTSEDQTKEMALARTARLELRNIRIEVEKTRVSLKEQSLREGKAIDGMSNIIKALIIPVEEHLEIQEKFAQLAREKRAAELKASRIEKLTPYVENVYVYALDDLDDEAFNDILANAKNIYEQKIAEEKATEAARLKAIEDERLEQERIRKENEKLRLEAEKRETEQIIKDAAIEKEREAERAKALKVQKEADKKLADERKAREEVERKVEAERVAQEKAKAEAEESERKALLAPDKEKLLTFAKAFVIIRDEKMPAVKTKQAQDILNKAEQALTNLYEMIVNSAKGL